MLHRANYKKGYLQSTIYPTTVQMILQDIGYGGGNKDRNIPQTTDTMRLVLWSVAYPNPSADPDKEIVTAEWVSGRIYNITRAQEGTEAGTHFTGDNVALLFTADMSREMLIFEDFVGSDLGSIAYTKDTDADGNMELVALSPDDEVSDPEGYKKVLVSGGVGRFVYPYWQFIYATEVGAKKA